MIRRPPRSTLFPTRRSSDLLVWGGVSALRIAALFLVFGLFSAVVDPDDLLRLMRRFSYRSRSEEHTSELQSRQYLVCRLLLEKKKKNSYHNIYTTNTLLYIS